MADWLMPNPLDITDTLPASVCPEWKECHQLT